MRKKLKVFPPPIDCVAPDETWKATMHSGKTGVFLFLLYLVWWRRSVGMLDDQKLFDKAVGKVLYLLQRMIAVLGESPEKGRKRLSHADAGSTSNKRCDHESIRSAAR